MESGSTCETFSTAHYGYPYTCECAFDGDTGSWWNTYLYQNPTPWIAIYFPQPYTLTQARVLPYQYSSYRAQNVHLEFSDSTVLNVSDTCILDKLC